MTNKDKAKQFLAYMEQGDKRCEFFLSLLSAMQMITMAECLEKIKRLAEVGE